MREVTPAVFLVAKTAIDSPQMMAYLRAVGGRDWWSDHDLGSAAEQLTEFAGRLCYRSWKPGLNPNVTKVRSASGEYLRNILAQKHGSVLEHVSYSFVFHNVSRILTHELARHRAGTAISQESMRYVRLTDIPIWLPDWVRDEGAHDAEMLENLRHLLARMEWMQRWMAGRFGLDDPGVPFSRKKALTSFMRRFAPDGVATSVLWTANVRTLRHVIEVRTAEGAEEEIRLVFGKVAEILREEAPVLFGDFTRHDDGSWVPQWSKV